jgi:hypothetical protein
MAWPLPVLCTMALRIRGGAFGQAESISVATRERSSPRMRFESMRRRQRYVEGARANQNAKSSKHEEIRKLEPTLSS